MKREKLFRTLGAVNGGLLKVEEVFLGLVTLALIAAIFIEVVCRYVFFVSTAWSEELARYLFVAMSFLGASYAYMRQEHIEIDIITQVLEKSKHIKDKARAKKIIRILAHVSTMTFLVIFCHIFFGYMASIQKIHLESPTMHLPMIAVYATVYLGCVFTIVHGVYMLLCELFNNQPNAR